MNSRFGYTMNPWPERTKPKLIGRHKYMNITQRWPLLLFHGQVILSNITSTNTWEASVRLTQSLKHRIERLCEGFATETTMKVLSGKISLISVMYRVVD